MMTTWMKTVNSTEICLLKRREARIEDWMVSSSRQLTNLKMVWKRKNTMMSSMEFKSNKTSRPRWTNLRPILLKHRLRSERDAELFQTFSTMVNYQLHSSHLCLGTASHMVARWMSTILARWMTKTARFLAVKDFLVWKLETWTCCKIKRAIRQSFVKHAIVATTWPHPPQPLLKNRM